MENLEQEYKDYIENNTRDSLTYFNLASYQDLQLKKYLEAAENYNNAIKYQSDYSTAYLNLAVLYEEKLGLYFKAEQMYNNLISLQENDPQKKIYLGQLYQDCMKNYTSSKNFFENLIKNDETNKDLYEEQIQEIEELIKKEDEQVQSFYIDEQQYKENYEELDEELGKGGQGVVKKIKDKHTGKLYAMKQVSSEQQQQEIEFKSIIQNLSEKARKEKEQEYQDSLVDIIEEAKKILKLQIKFNSKYIVKIQFVKQIKTNLDTPSVFLCMEMAQKTLMDIERPLDNQQIVNLIKNVLKGLAQIFYQNMIHKDMKPSNILYFKESVSFKIADFGVANYTKNEKNITITKQTLRGTQSYISPELYELVHQQGGAKLTNEQTKSIDWQANDIFGAGLSFFEAICDIKNIYQYRFDDNNMKQQLNKVQNEKPHISPIVFKIIELMTYQKQENRAKIDDLILLSHLL